MWAELKAIKTERRNLRQFAALVFFAGIGLGGWQLYSSRPLGFWFLAIGGFLGGAGWFCPFLLKPFYLVWMGIAVVLGNIVSRLVLIVTFYGLLTPMGLVFRLLGKGFNSSKEAATYWISRDDFSMKPEKYERQF